MNVRFYGQKAYAGTVEMCQRLDVDATTLTSMYTRHHHEQLVGAELEVRSATLTSTTKLRLYHELRNRTNDDLAATFVHEFDHPPIDTPGYALPVHGMPRTISIDGDRLASAPDLAAVQALGLDMRLARVIDDEDTLGTDHVPPWLGANLIWGGERAEESDDWIQTLDDGRQMAFATMESRLWLAGTPSKGTRIQSFGATIAVRDKITHSMNWSYDIDTGDVIAAFETVNLAFDMVARRAMSIPDHERASWEERLHPELLGD